MNDAARPPGLGSVALATFAAMLPVTLVVPVLGPLVQQRFSVGDFATSLFMSVNMVAASVAAPLAGLVSDALGSRKRLIVSALVLDAALLSLLAHAPSYGLLMVLRFLEGAAHITALSLLLALGADRARRLGTGRAMGLVGAALTLGVALGAPLGGVLGRDHPVLPLEVGAWLLLGAALGTAWLVHETPAEERHTGVLAAWNLARSTRGLFVPYAFAFVDRFTVGFFVTSFPLYLTNVHGAEPGRIGWLLALFLLPFSLTCYPVGRLSQASSRALWIGGGSLAYGMGLLALGWIPLDSLGAWMLGLGLLSGVMFVPSLMLACELAGARLRGTAMGGFNAAGSLGFLVGPAVAGAITGGLARPDDPAFAYRLAFFVAGAAEVICVLVLLGPLRRAGHGVLVEAAGGAASRQG